MALTTAGGVRLAERKTAVAAAEPQWWCAAGGLISGEAVAGQALEFPVNPGKFP